MDGRRSDLVEVLRGEGPDGLTWRMVAGGDDHDFATFVERRRGEFRASSGMRGPKLYPGEVANHWIGQAGGVPPFVMVRAASTVSRVDAVGASGREYPLAMSDVVEAFQLRFGGTFVPGDDPIVELRVSSASP